MAVYGFLDEAKILDESKSGLGFFDRSKVKKTAKELEKVLPKVINKYNQNKSFQKRCKDLIVDEYKKELQNGITPDSYLEKYANDPKFLPSIEPRPIGSVAFFKYGNTGYLTYNVTDLGDDAIGYATEPAIKELSDYLQQDKDIQAIAKKNKVGITIVPYDEDNIGIPSAINIAIEMINKNIVLPKQKGTNAAPGINHSDLVPEIEKSVEKVLKKYNSSSKEKEIKEDIEECYKEYGSDDPTEISYATSIISGKRKIHPFKIYDSEYNMWSWKFKDKTVKSDLILDISDEAEIVQYCLQFMAKDIADDIAKEIKGIDVPHMVITRSEYTDDTYTEIEILFFT